MKEKMNKVSLYEVINNIRLLEVIMRQLGGVKRKNE